MSKAMAACAADCCCTYAHRLLHPAAAPLAPLLSPRTIFAMLTSRTPRSQGICLRNMQAYGGWWDLQLKLLCEPKLKIRLSEAKKYKFVKMCLIMLYC